MEPKHPAPNARLERSPSPVESGKQETVQPFVERAVAENGERERGAQLEVGAVQAEARQVAMPAFPAPVSLQSSDDTAAPALSSDNTPTTAGDDDLIEKEWVDKAKKILADTRDDPYRREQEVGKLQVEYIRKRYGREIGGIGGE